MQYAAILISRRHRNGQHPVAMARDCNTDNWAFAESVRVCCTMSSCALHNVHWVLHNVQLCCIMSTVCCIMCTCAAQCAVECCTMCSRDDDRITPSHCRERCLALSGRLRTKCSNIGFVWSRLAPLLCPWINRNVEFPASLIVSLLSSALCRLNHIDCSGATRITEGKGKKIELTEFDISAVPSI